MARFDFIKRLMEEVRYPEFFRCEPLSSEERKRVEALPNLPESYLEFLRTFGRARFFRELYRNRHKLEVYPPPRKLWFNTNSYTVEFGGRRASIPAMFKLSELRAHTEPPVYDWAMGTPRRRWDSFTDWLTWEWERARQRYTKKDWARVQAGPEPFNEDEQRVVEIRRRFSWRQLEPQNGKIAVEITNNSDGYLGKYSIGVRAKHGELSGGYHLDVSKIGPGMSEVIVQSPGYERLNAEEAELFSKGEPEPHTRGDFWEFKSVKEKSEVQLKSEPNPEP